MKFGSDYNKRKSRAFGKDVYLLGEDEQGIKYWLEAPKWSCGWYWGFGYIETYTNNNNPSLAVDINSHQHFSGFVGSQEYYDHEKGCFRKGDYIHNIYDNPTFVKTTFTENEGWTLSELMKTFYRLRETAELFKYGSSGVTTNPCADILKDEEKRKHINEVLIPEVTKRVLKILDI